MLDKIEFLGSAAGKLLDSKLSLYEIKLKRPPIRLYFKIVKNSAEAYVFEHEMKTNPKKQQKTINRIKEKSKT
ncbi:MAG: hypothetical protein COV47_04975 [Candidatus Diapherotrites archaeon CG11_big_fil_rev_8_21_14_0_20_37_9]|nr:MAG: hypothetical protein COV47_04975 [Candidatus Diapherotrites archaeon CG11_big_fil_rev_8_21_14_0_20_37_9]